MTSGDLLLVDSQRWFDDYSSWQTLLTPAPPTRALRNFGVVIVSLRRFGSFISLGEYTEVRNLMGSLVGGSLSLEWGCQAHVFVTVQDARVETAPPMESHSGHGRAHDSAKRAARQVALSLRRVRATRT